MTKQKSTKRALLMSGLALLMCVSMLIGSTFAWFTDSVTSGNNKIVAGTLDVQLLMDTGSGYVDISESTSPIFGEGSIAQNNNAETLWEPGKTQVAYLAIKNNGNLDLKYTVGLDVQNVSEDLYKVMEYAIVADATKDSPVTSWTGGNSVVVGTQSVSGDVALKEGETHYFALAIHMNEDAGNEYQGGEVNFDLTVLATQLASEYDSFGNQYDANATYGTYIELNAGDDLMAALASAEADMPLTIKLNGDVEWPTTGTHGEKNITPASSIVIDGNGYTLTATGSGVTPLGDDNAPMTLKNIKIVDKSVSYAEDAWEFTYLEIGGSTLTCSNVTFADEIMLGTNATFTNCSFESNEESIYAVWVDDGSAAFNNCTFTGYRGLKAHEDYGSEISSVVVKNCTFDSISKKPGIALGTLNADTTVSITGSSFINCQPGDQNKYIYETDTDVSTFKFTNENNAVVQRTSVDSAAELESALKEGYTEIGIAGKITLEKGLSANNVTLVGVGADAAIDFAGYNITGNGSSTITYKNLTLTTVSLPYGGEGVGERYGWYGGIDYANHATANYEDCTISGVFTLYSKTVNVNGCTFLPYVQDGTTFNQIFQYGTQTANITDCTFYYSNRAIKVYNEGYTKDLVMNVSGCTFKADESFDENYNDNKALISIDPTYVTSVKLTVKDVTIDDALNGIALHNGESDDKITVTVE